jgi:hypothetical protein
MGEKRDPYFRGETIRDEKKAGRKRNLREKTKAENFQCFNGRSCPQLTLHIATL